MLLAASTQRTIGFAILAIVFIGGLVYLFFNIRAAKAEIGSEVELAANRAPALRDEDLEGRRLDLALAANLAMLTIIAIALPFYWLGEPGREEGRNKDIDRIFTNRGEDIYIEGAQCVSCHGAAGAGGSTSTALTTDDGGFIAQVVWKAPALNTVLSRFSEDEVLHTLNFGRNGVMPAWGAGGGGPLTDQQLEEVIYYLRSIQIDAETIASEVEAGVLQRAEEYVVDGTDDTGAFVYVSPALTEVREASAAQLEATLAVEALDIDCGDADLDEDETGLCDTLAAATDRFNEANAAAGEEIDALAVAFLAEAEGARVAAEMMALDDDDSLEGDALRWATLELLSDPDGGVPNVEAYWKYGEFLFTNPAANATYSCARCHTFGFSYDAAERYTLRANGTTESPLDEYVQGDGYFGPNLRGGSTTQQFETARTHAQFIESGQTIGVAYGRGGSGGNGQMPGFGSRVETDAVGPSIGTDDEFFYPATLTSDQIDAIVAFERTLP
ncbi:MAG: cytochrome c [Acidimicrobiales bacterium]|nr:cytochrome c [Acidimicrobiales bacterium]